MTWPALKWSLLDYPPELVKEMLSHLRHDGTALAACALTCKALLSPARLVLYRTMYIDDNRQASRPRRLPPSLGPLAFFELLLRNPEIAAAVQFVHIATLHGYNAPQIMLPVLPNVRIISFESEADSDIRQWNSMYISSALDEVVQRLNAPFVQQTTLSACLSDSIIHMLRTINHITLHLCDISSLSPHRAGTQEERPQPESLVIHSIAKTLSDDQMKMSLTSACPLDFSRLRSIGLGEGTFPSATGIFHALGSLGLSCVTTVLFTIRKSPMPPPQCD